MDFTVTVKPSFEEYERFNRVVRNTIGNTRTKTIVLVLLFLLIVAFLLWMGEYLLGSFMLVTLILSFVLAKVRTRRIVRKSWDTNAVLRENESVFRFSENGIDITTSNGCAHIDYDKLYRLIETKTHFYLLSAVNMGSGFPKTLCTPEQQAFIRERCAK